MRIKMIDMAQKKQVKNTCHQTIQLIPIKK